MGGTSRICVKSVYPGSLITCRIPHGKWSPMLAAWPHPGWYLLLVALIGGVEMRIATYEIAFCFHILLLSLLTVGRFRVSVSPTKDNCPGVNQLEGGMLLVPCSTF